VVRAMGPVLEDVASSVDEASDLELIEQGLPGNLLLLRGLLRGSPEDRSLLLLGAKACYGYAFAFLEDEGPARAVALYREGLDYSARALRDPLDARDPQTLVLGELEGCLSRTDQGDVPGLFWLASNWGRWIQLEGGKPRVLAQLPKVVAVMERVLALDESYFHAAPHVFFGVYYGARAPALGGDAALAAAHLERAIEISEGRFLLARVYRAQYVYAPSGDRAAFARELQEVLGYPLDQAPSIRFYNEIALREARKLLARTDALFELLE
jgi:hypothetical protein